MGAINRPTITVKEARKLFDPLIANSLTNEELEAFVQDTETVVKLILYRFLRSKNAKKC